MAKQSRFEKIKARIAGTKKAPCKGVAGGVNGGCGRASLSAAEVGLEHRQDAAELRDGEIKPAGVRG